MWVVLGCGSCSDVLWAPAEPLACVCNADVMSIAQTSALSMADEMSCVRKVRRQGTPQDPASVTEPPAAAEPSRAAEPVQTARSATPPEAGTAAKSQEPGAVAASPNKQVRPHTRHVPTHHTCCCKQAFTSQWTSAI